MEKRPAPPKKAKKRPKVAENPPQMVKKIKEERILEEEVTFEDTFEPTFTEDQEFEAEVEQAEPPEGRYATSK